MSYVPLIIAGYVYNFGTTTPMNNVIVAVKNKSTGEEHNGSEGSFNELTTNSLGEWQVNLANYTDGYSNNDLIEISLNEDGKKDLILHTISGNNSVSSIVLTPLTEDVYDYERSVDEVGGKIIIYRESRTLDSDYENISTETITRHPIEDDTYATIQIQGDEISLEEQGQVTHGIARGFFKVRYDIEKDNRIRVPTDTDNIWVVMDKPIRYYFKNQPLYDEARLMRVDATFATAAAGSVVSTLPVAQDSVYIYGSSCTGTEGDYNRVLTVSTDSTPTMERVYLDGVRLTVGIDYDADYNSSSLAITFSGVSVWDSQKITVDYSK